MDGHEVPTIGSLQVPWVVQNSAPHFFTEVDLFFFPSNKHEKVGPKVTSFRVKNGAISPPKKRGETTPVKPIHLFLAIYRGVMHI